MTRTAAHVAIVSALLTSSIIALLFVWAPEVSDWRGYEMIYNQGGAWLYTQGRDRGFVWLIDAANRVFGQNGYESFRLVLHGAFVAFAAWLAWRLPKQPRLGVFQPLVVAAAVASVLLVKSGIQIREGIAFGLVVIALVEYYRGRGRLRTPALLTAATTVHAAMLPYLGLYIVAFGLLILLDALLPRWAAMRARDFRWSLFYASLPMAVVFSFILQRVDFTFILSDFAVDVSADAQSGALKTLYWLTQGVMIWLLLQQIAETEKDHVTSRSLMFTRLLAMAYLPGLYVLGLTLVLSEQLPALTSGVMRLLFTAMQLGILIVFFAGRANRATLLLVVWITVDAIRAFQGALIT